MKRMPPAHIALARPAASMGRMRPRMGVCAGFDAARAAKLAALLESSIQRRFPKGLKVHVHSVDRFGCLAALARVLKLANLTVTRAKVC